MQYSFFLGIALLIFGITSCESSKKSSNKGQNESEAVSAAQDTLPPTPEPVLPAPAPGTVRLKAKIIDVHDTGNDTKTVDLYVLQTLAYGASTPTVATKDTMHIAIKEIKGLTKGATIIGTLQYRESIAGFGKAQSNWYLLNFSNDKD